MHKLMPALAAASLLVAGSAAAREPDKPDKPITQDDPGAIDVAKTPVTDLNIDRQEIPQILIDAQRRPYALAGSGRCEPILAEVEKLDALLGPDLDLPQDTRERISAGRVGQ